MEITCKRRKFDVTSKDVVMFNGACYILITQKYFSYWHNVSPTISKIKCQKWINDGVLVLDKTVNAHSVGCTYYRF